MRLTILLFIILGIGQACRTKNEETKTDHTKSEIEQLSKEQLPESVSIKGNIISIQKWTDNLGVNYFILSGTDEFAPQKAIDARNEYVIREGDTIFSGAKDYRDKEIYMTHFVTSDIEAKTFWNDQDSVRDCAVDLELSFLEEYPRITDLDKNGVSEIWTVYHKGCHGDVSPTEMKVSMIMLGHQFVLSGRRIANIGGGRKVGGEIYTNMFAKTLTPFKTYADSLWIKYKNWN
jgi:hypothetical protein